MELNSLKHILNKPFSNLSVFDRWIQFLRFLPSFLVILFGLVVLVGPNVSPVSFYVTRFDGYSADISNGLFTYLKAASDVPAMNGDEYQLSTSEVELFVDYSSSKVNGIPQYITLSLYKRCDIRFDVESRFNDDGNLEQKRNSTESDINCIDVGSSYIFDYREALLDFGLYIILEFAYEKPTDHNASSEQLRYDKMIDSFRRKESLAVNMLIVVLSVEAVIIVLTIWYYCIKGRSIDTIKEKILVHTISTLSFVNLVCGLLSGILFFTINLKLRSDINFELSPFGFSFHLGKSWHGCLGVLLIMIVMSCFMWSGIEWCIADTTAPDTVDAADTHILKFNKGVFTDVNEPTALNPTSDELEEQAPDMNKIDIFSDDNALDENRESFELQELTRMSSSSDEFDAKPIEPSSTMRF
ncbi:hypothetical protein Kpol_1001p10 [Vanderwaltozyma polyspora DSM 70294]|uniref:Protein ECM7 n=1 Tax=Vanderwaltozyma polyspora (strain ATCC 22028 / DSM 70294 / BCRC 21397 / CBS 2163 / NBRC 10782 / NRRL Y-8283 / UCD 57-17) TaxID=436907 RepID=A7TNP7_VANPO|nr:uncharacterized protein Kpol_1001p10 [Vanderwaltozyma polyspora DSM 70294]EDO16098.1 hypothetical protein Kpol_1001p10 [Vanderwaltozyma polyspora DSM 70294]